MYTRRKRKRETVRARHTLHTHGGTHLWHVHTHTHAHTHAHPAKAHPGHWQAHHASSGGTHTHATSHATTHPSVRKAAIRPHVAHGIVEAAHSGGDILVETSSIKGPRVHACATIIVASAPSPEASRWRIVASALLCRGIVVGSRGTPIRVCGASVPHGPVFWQCFEWVSERIGIPDGELLGPLLASPKRLYLPLHCCGRLRRLE